MRGPCGSLAYGVKAGDIIRSHVGATVVITKNGSQIAELMPGNAPPASNLAKGGRGHVKGLQQHFAGIDGLAA
jgi:hypothetical protein